MVTRFMWVLALAGCAEEIDRSDFEDFDPNGYEVEGDFADTEATEASDDIDVDGDGVEARKDCDDFDAAVHPGADEICDGIDNDCDGRIDDEDGIIVDAISFWADADGDGFGDPLSHPLEGCVAPEGYVANDLDCDDDDARFNPTAIEDDCTDPNDYNCDGSVGFDDSDSDGFAACEDCDDSNSTIRPGVDEVCDGLDNNCDGIIDVGAVDALTFYRDGDQDGFGDDSQRFSACEVPQGFAEAGGDCDDADAATWPGAPEACDGVDQDCAGLSWLEGDADGDGLLACETALWVNTEQGGSAGLQAAMGDAAALLESRGIENESANLSDAPFDPTTMSDVGLIVLYGDGSEVLDSIEASLLESHVSAGGSVLLRGGDASEESCAFMDSLPSAWGLSCKNQTTWSTLAPTIATHEVTDGVQVVTLQDAENWSVQSPSTAVVFDGASAAVVVAEIGQGRVAGVADEWMFYPEGSDAAFDISAHDNGLLVDNLWAWLLEQGM